MNKFYVSKGAFYVLVGIVSPLLLEHHPVMAVIQTTLLVGLGGAYIVKGARCTTSGEGKHE